jgi:hypothetical protein
MKLFHNPRMYFFVLALTGAALLVLISCGAPLQTALTMKQNGKATTYSLPFDQTYTAMRTALRWSSDQLIEDHKEQNYVLSLAALSSRSTGYNEYCIIWFDSLAQSETRVTLLTSSMAGGISRRDFVENLQRYMDYAAKLTKEGKPLPIMP